MEPTVTLSMTDQLTLHVLTQLDAASITASQAATLLGKSVRQIRRKLKAYRERAASGTRRSMAQPTSPSMLTASRTSSRSWKFSVAISPPQA